MAHCTHNCSVLQPTTYNLHPQCFRGSVAHGIEEWPASISTRIKRPCSRYSHSHFGDRSSIPLWTFSCSSNVDKNLFMQSLTMSVMNMCPIYAWCPPLIFMCSGMRLLTCAVCTYTWVGAVPFVNLVFMLGPYVYNANGKR